MCSVFLIIGSKEYLGNSNGGDKVFKLKGNHWSNRWLLIILASGVVKKNNTSHRPGFPGR